MMMFSDMAVHPAVLFLGAALVLACVRPGVLQRVVLLGTPVAALIAAIGCRTGSETCTILAWTCCSVALIPWPGCFSIALSFWPGLARCTACRFARAPGRQPPLPMRPAARAWFWPVIF